MSEQYDATLKLRWMTTHGYFLCQTASCERMARLSRGDGSYALWFTDGGTGLHHVKTVSGPFMEAVNEAFQVAQDDNKSRTPLRFFSYLKDGVITAQIPTGIRDDEAIGIDTFLRNLGKLADDEEVATTYQMEEEHTEGGRLDDPDLIQLIWSEDDHNAFTTFERMARHLHRCHNIMEADIWGKSQEDLQRMHTGLHMTSCDHQHPKPVVVVGHEPKGLEEN